MRLANLYFRTVAVASLILAVSSCQTAQKPVALLPPTTAPALKPTAANPSTSKAAAPAAAPAASASTAKASPKPAQTQEPAEATAPAKQSADSDAIADLIARVEKEYQAGLANYRDGKIDAAKKNFDNAVNALLGSQVDIRSDDRLEKEFEHIVAGVDQLNLGDFSSDSDNPQDGQQEAQQEAQQEQTKNEEKKK